MRGRLGIVSEASRLPPLESFNPRETKVLNQIFHAFGNNRDGRGHPTAAHFTCDRTKRWPVEVIHVRMRDKDGIDRREIGDAESGTSLASKNDEARSEDGVNQQGLAGGLDEKRRMADKSDRGLAVFDDRRNRRCTRERLGMALSYQPPELTQFPHPERNSDGHCHLEYRCVAGEKEAELTFRECGYIARAAATPEAHAH